MGEIDSGGSPMQHVQWLNARIWRLRKEGDFVEAIRLAREVCDFICDAGGAESVVYAQALGSRGRLLQDAGLFDEAEADLVDAVKLQRRLVVNPDADLVALLRGLAVLHRGQQHFTEARKLFEEIVGILRDLRASDDSGEAQLVEQLSNLGGVAKALGDYAAAGEAFDEAIEIQTRLSVDHPRYALALNNRAGLYDVVGDYIQAERLYLAAQEIWAQQAESSQVNAKAMNNLGALYYRQGRFAEAGPLLEAARETLERIDTPAAKEELGATLVNLATFYRDTRQMAAALTAATAALRLLEPLLGENHPLVADALGALGFVHLSMGQAELAKEDWQRSHRLRIARLGKDHPDVANSLRNLAVVSLAQNDPSVALDYLLAAAAITDASLDQIFSISSERQRLAHVETLRFTLDAVLTVVVRHMPSDSAAVGTAFERVLRQRGLAAEALAAQRDGVLAAKSPELAARFQELKDLRQRVAGEATSLSGDRARLAALQSRQEMLEAELATSVPEIQVMRALRTMNAESVARALPAGSALIEYVRYREIQLGAKALAGEEPGSVDRYVAFILTGDALPSLVDLGEAQAIDGLVAASRLALGADEPDAHARVAGERPTPEVQGDPLSTALRSGLRDLGDPEVGEAPTDEFDPAPGRLLRRKVVDPVLHQVAEARRLIVAPDGDLTRVPFEALPLDGASFMIDHYRLSYLAVGRDLARTRPSEAGSSSPVVVADPDFDLAAEPPPQLLTDASAGPFSPLPNTMDEGVIIAGLLQVPCLAGPEALKSTVLALQGPRILHLATHGYVAALDPTVPSDVLDMARPYGPDPRARFGRLANPLLRSGIALAGANSWLNGHTPPADAGNGLLSAEEMTGLDLIGTELVVLSACETGLGVIHADEGVLGLRRSTVIAGAQTLVMSLWPVSDPATAELMSVFYRRLVHGEARSDALRDAQLAVRETNPHPWFWGAFICQGDWRPLPASGNTGSPHQ